jgi:hypothetical protein
MTPNPSIERTMSETLPSWRDGAAKQAITDFVARGWTVVNMKDDWKTIFPLEKK